ncbi:MAG TPA: hypothetical protein VFM98_25865 [Ramlibacter sp.]|uniref:hypothetical protein n=1 Tax=Ramlibacter sp. TaxID=1917967 RepID=UPI002D80CDF1|nr:hypothetical protein [Ramlibacter sp.]HET8749046.1 hypothetical protein [Ramlibacter sp.]
MKRRDFLAGAAALVQLPGAELPLALQFRDSAGRSVRLGDFFDGVRPVLLVPGYWHCPQLCGLVMQSLLDALHKGGVAREGFRIVGFSVAPEDTPADARKRRASDLAFAGFLLQGKPAHSPIALELLVARGDASARLAGALGVRYVPSAQGYEHPAVVIVATPSGRVARYLPGLGLDPGELRVALAEARGGRIAGIGERIALFCSHLEPQPGAHTGAVMTATRITGLGAAAALAAWCWRRRHGAQHGD